MQDCHIISDNNELYDFLVKHNINNHHDYAYIIQDCAAFKVADKGYAYYSWISENDMTLHAAFIKPITLEKFADITRIAYYLGAKRLIIDDPSDKARKAALFFGFKKINDNKFVLELPDDRVKMTIDKKRIRDEKSV